MDYSTPYDPTVTKDADVDMHQCYVTEDVFHESEMIHDNELNRWFHVSKKVEYNELLAIEFDWSEEEAEDNLKILTL